jgi:hypothetical protein
LEYGVTRRVQEYAQALAGLLIADQFEEMTDLVTYPLALHVEEVFVSVLSAEAAARLTRAFRDILRRHGVTRVETEVKAIELPRRARLRAWVEYRHFAGGARLDADTQLILYASVRQPRILRAEMMQFTRIGFPEWKAHLPETAVAI